MIIKENDLKEKKGHIDSFRKLGIVCSLGSPLYMNFANIGSLWSGSY